MLRHLHIQNYALISHLDIDFGPGFSVLTGETGAGKSIILGALGLVMGAKADARAITEGEERCIIEAEFDGYIIRRELHAAGRSRSFVNDEVVSQAELKELAKQLIDIHSQHENLLIADDTFQREVIDALADNQTERDAYTTAYTAYTEACARLEELETLIRKSRSDEDYIRFQFEQLSNANLVADELEELEQEEYRLSHAEEIGMHLQQAIAQLGDDGGALSLIRASKIDANAELSERLQSVAIELKDIVAEAERELDRTEVDPERLAAVQERLDLIQTLLRKHSVQTIDELIAIRDKMDGQLQTLDNFDEQLKACQQHKQQSLQVLKTAADALTATRQQVREKISQQMIGQLTALGIRHANIDIEISPLPHYEEHGGDNIQILFAANLNQSLRRVSEIASGGEISRVMLSIKSLIASRRGLPTIIFDEIDTGVSGEIARQMGNIMHDMGASRQILAITHLPQIALQGDRQYRVYKADTDTRTETHISEMTSEERKEYIQAYNATIS